MRGQVYKKIYNKIYKIVNLTSNGNFLKIFWPALNEGGEVLNIL